MDGPAPFVNTQRQSEHLHHDLPESRLHLMPGAGHMIHQLAPDDVMAAIDQAAQAGGAGRQRTPAPAHVFPAPTRIN